MKLDDLFSAKYEMGARGPAAYDCYGLFLEVNNRAGLMLEDNESPEDYALRDALIMDEAKKWVKLPAPKPLCAVALRIGKFISHVGVVLEDGVHFIHTSSRTGVVVERLDNPRWSQRIAGFYEYQH